MRTLIAIAVGAALAASCTSEPVELPTTTEPDSATWTENQACVETLAIEEFSRQLRTADEARQLEEVFQEVIKSNPEALPAIFAILQSEAADQCAEYRPIVTADSDN